MATNKTQQPPDNDMTIHKIGRNWIATTGSVDAAGWTREVAISRLREKLRAQPNRQPENRHSQEGLTR